MPEIVGGSREWDEEDYSPSQEFSPRAYQHSYNIAKTLLQRMGGLQIGVMDELPPEGAAILAPKHLSNMDVPVVGTATMDIYGRPIRFLAKRELWESRFIGSPQGRFFERNGGIRFDRDRRLDEQPVAMEQVDKALGSGALLGLFLEGTRTPGREVGPIKQGFGLMAVEKKLPTQPVGLAGTDRPFGYKVVIFGRVVPHESDDIDPEDKRAKVRRAREIAADVAAGMRETTRFAYQALDQHAKIFP